MPNLCFALCDSTFDIFCWCIFTSFRYVLEDFCCCIHLCFVFIFVVTKVGQVAGKYCIWTVFILFFFLIFSYAAFCSWWQHCVLFWSAGLLSWWRHLTRQSFGDKHTTIVVQNLWCIRDLMLLIRPSFICIFTSCSCDIRAASLFIHILTFRHAPWSKATLWWHLLFCSCIAFSFFFNLSLFKNLFWGLIL